VSAPADRAPSVGVFEAARPRLLGLAYRMLGTLHDAEDVVQDAWLRWDSVDHDTIQTPDAWLTTVTTRLALDRIRANRRRREEYVGPWLPEPVVTERGPEDAAEIADSLTLGFLTVLDRLNPVERAVFLLADVFGAPYAEVAEAVGKSEVACRQIASRSRRRLQASHVRRPTGDERRVADALLVAVALGDADAVLQRLAPDVVSISDGGPNRRAARRPVVGAARVSRFMMNFAHRVHDRLRYVPVTVNGDPGMMVYDGDDIEFVMAFEVQDALVHTIWIIRNPEKLDHVLAPLALV
jgi:RNA polymerase sigma-70 factor, ECF subfamily